MPTTPSNPKALIFLGKRYILGTEHRTKYPRSPMWEYVEGRRSWNFVPPTFILHDADCYPTRPLLAHHSSSEQVTSCRSHTIQLSLPDGTAATVVLNAPDNPVKVFFFHCSDAPSVLGQIKEGAGLFMLPGRKHSVIWAGLWKTERKSRGGEQI